MFTEDKIAPCGLNCALCKHALDAERPCDGCNSVGGAKGVYCATMCEIVKCGKRKALPDRFCDLCADYPCADLVEKETRYANQYPMAESPMGNLDCIRKKGMDAFLKREARRWTCACGGTICVHTGVCAGCGRAYSDHDRSVNR